MRDTRFFSRRRLGRATAYGLLLTGAALFLWSLFQLLPIAKARLGTIRRDERGDPPLLALTGAGGIVIVDPCRSWGPATVINGEVSQPLLTHPDYQDGTT